MLPLPLKILDSEMACVPGPRCGGQGKAGSCLQQHLALPRRPPSQFPAHPEQDAHKRAQTRPPPTPGVMTSHPGQEGNSHTPLVCGGR